MSIKVTKVTGDTELYSEDKIRNSASRVGVPVEVQSDMLADIRTHLYDGIPTSEIFHIIKDYLHRSSLSHLASKYNLKVALSEIGPSGYPFEQYISLLLTAIGYTTTTNVMLQGACVTHEIDVLAKKDGKTWFIEAKFHHNQSERTDVKVTLYIRARFEDVSEAWHEGECFPWIVTNTRFSTEALDYARCRNIRVTSWGYPVGDGIMDLIERTGLHPITILDSLTTEDKTRLLAAKIVTCRQLLEGTNSSLLPASIREQVLREVQAVCASAKS